MRVISLSEGQQTPCQYKNIGENIQSIYNLLCKTNEKNCNFSQIFFSIKIYHFTVYKVQHLYKLWEN